jgi:uncharacterized protein (TIGR00297 family)
LISMSVEVCNDISFKYLLFFILLAILIPFFSLIYIVSALIFLLVILLLKSQLHDVPQSSLFGMSLGIFIIGSLAILMEYLKYEFPLYIVGASISITCAGIAAACVIRSRSSRKPELDDKFISATSSIGLIVIGALTACVMAYWIIGWLNVGLTLSQLFFLTLIGAVTGALLESIPSRTDKNLTMILGSFMIMWLFASFGYYVNFFHLSAIFIFSLFLAYLAYHFDIADVSAMLSATLLGVLIIVFTNFNWYLILITFFLLGGGFTRYGYDYKHIMGVAQSKEGVRSYENVLCNSIIALILAVAYGMYHMIYPRFSEVLMFAYLGAVATATGDTLASEIGETYRGKPVMITNLKPAKPGTDGAVSRLGELVCIAGSFIIGVLALILGVIDLPVSGPTTFVFWILIVILGGFMGTNFDSLLGATLQQRGWLSNSGVNLVATMCGAFISGAAYYILSGHVV